MKFGLFMNDFILYEIILKDNLISIYNFFEYLFDSII